MSPRPSHRARVCHAADRRESPRRVGARLLALALAVTPLACASATGWTRERSRSCERDGPPRVCVVVEPDRQLVFEVGGTELVPQECAEGPEGRRGGSLRITARDGATGDEARRRVHVRRGRELTLTAEAPLKLRVVERARCEHP